MEWKDLGDIVGKAAPILGTLLGGPVGGAAGSLIASVLGVGNTPDAVQQAIVTNPDAAVKLAQIEAEKSVQLQALLVDQMKAQLASELGAAQAVNQTMQAEAGSEHWPTYSWRPAIGFSFALGTVGSVLTIFVAYAMQIFDKDPAGIQALPGILTATAGVLATSLPVLGVASWFRGQMQVGQGQGKG